MGYEGLYMSYLSDSAFLFIVGLLGLSLLIGGIFGLIGIYKKESKNLDA